jgi:hypothetical protein
VAFVAGFSSFSQVELSLFGMLCNGNQKIPNVGPDLSSPPDRPCLKHYLTGRRNNAPVELKYGTVYFLSVAITAINELKKNARFASILLVKKTCHILVCSSAILRIAPLGRFGI